MTVGGALILYATAVGLAGAVGFRRALWPLRAPRLGAAAVLAAAWSVPVALVLAGMTIILPPSALFADVGRLVGACLVRLRAAYGTPAGAGIVTAGQVLSVATLGRIAWAIGRVGHRRRTERRRHRLLVRLAGGRRPDVPAVVLDCPGPAAYSVAISLNVESCWPRVLPPTLTTVMSFMAYRVASNVADGHAHSPQPEPFC